MGPRIQTQEPTHQRIIWTVRHGQRVDNIDGSWRNRAPRGAWDDPNLSSRGLQQAQECGAHLAKEQFDVILCSPFIRCVQTAYAISTAHSKNLPIFIEPGICESLHVCQNPPGFLSTTELHERFPSVSLSYDPIVTKLVPEKNEIECEGRLSQVIEKAEQRFAGNILIVSHGAPIAMLHKILAGEWHYVGQCTISKFVSSSNGYYKAILSGDCSHLSDKTNLREREIQKPLL